MAEKGWNKRMVSLKQRAFHRGKYIAVGLLLFLTAGVCSGCGGSKETAESGETTELFDGGYTMSPAGVLRVNDHGYLQFYSRESDGTVYLCNQAGCSHQDRDCSAYAENLQNAFYYHDDLYFIQFYGANQHTQVLKANRYGENRQLLGEMDVFLIPFTMHIYGDTLYFIGDKWDFEKDTSTQELYAFQLGDGTIEALPNVDTGYLIANVLDYFVTDRYLYRKYTASDIDINDYFDVSTGELREIEWDDIVYANLLYRTDRRTGETELLIKEEGTDQDHVDLTILDAEEENFTIRLYDSILRYEGKEWAETLYTYSGDADWWQIKPFGEGYLICEYGSEYRCRILENFAETDSFTDPDGGIDYYYGALGDTLYFSGNSVLYYMEMDDFKAGNYEFHAIDFD